MEQILVALVCGAIVVVQIALAHRARLREIQCDHIRLTNETIRIHAEAAANERAVALQMRLAEASMIQPPQEVGDAEKQTAPVGPWGQRLSGLFQHGSEAGDGSSAVGG